MSKLRILFTGGGTGGHIYPLISVAEQLKKHAATAGLDPDFRYYGQPGDYRDALESAGIKISRVATSKLRRYFSLLNILDFFKFFIAIAQSLFKIYWFMPDVVFSKGGPGAVSVVLVSFFYGIPIVIHESDTVPGLTTRISSHFAKVIELGFSGAAQHFKKFKGKIGVVGNPVRDFVFEKTEQVKAKEKFGFSAIKSLILIFGGSQGSNRMNDFVIANLEALLVKYQILHSIGSEKFIDYQNQFNFLTKNFSPLLLGSYKFVDHFGRDFSEAMDAADLIVSRGGAGALFEIAAKGKPSIIVPFPEAAADHQKENAYEYARAGAGVVIEQENLLPSIFFSEADKILNNSDVKVKMSAAATGFSRPDAAKHISVDILELIK